MLVRNRKGFAGDILFVIIALCVLGAFIFIGYTIFDSINNNIQGGDNLSTHSKELVQDNVDRYVSLWDGIFLLVFVLYTIALILSVAALGSSPEFFFVIVFIGIILVGIGAMLGNVFTTFADELPNATAAFTYIPLFYNYVAEITLALLAMFMLGLFAKARGTI